MDNQFLRNAWYVAAWSSEVGEKPFSRTLLGESVLLLRRADGSAAAIGNRCPHRFAPLDRGQRVGDAIQCAYHGLRFDMSGACVHVPGGQAPPRAARVRGFALAERDGIVWLWGGDPAQADVALLPDTSPLSDAGRLNIIDNTLRTEAGYLLTLDNLMDLSHVEFLHPTTLGSDRVAEGRLTVVEKPRSVESNRWMPGIEAPPFIGRSMDMTGTVDHWTDMTWHAGSNLVLRVGLTRPGAGRAAGREAIAYHLITPETRTSSHYFYGHSMNYGMDIPGLGEIVRKGVMGVFIGEDKPMIEACARMMEGKDLSELDPVLIRSDGGAVKMRRALAKLLEAEQAGGEAATH